MSKQTLRIFINNLACFFLLLLLSLQGANAELRGLPHITVLSAASLAVPVTQIARGYSRQKNVTVTASFDVSAEQAHKIDSGNPADIFISSSSSYISQLKQKGVVDVYSITNVVKNRLVLVAAKDSKASTYASSYNDVVGKILAASKITTMVIGNPVDTPLGIYTSKTIYNLSPDLWNYLTSKTLKTDNSAAALYMVAKGNRSGIIYASDAWNNPEIDIIHSFDEKLHDPIIYQAAVIAGESMVLARDFLHFLRQDQAKQIFIEHGFVVD